MIYKKDRHKVKYLIKNGMKYGLKNPKDIQTYLKQQGFDDITTDEIKNLMV